MTSFVRIALAGAGSFAKMEIRAGDDIADLAKRGCTEFPSWKADSAQLSLYLVAAGGDDEPVEEAISAVLSSGRRLGVGWSLTRAEISSGAWLVARKIVDSGGCGGGGGGGGGEVGSALMTRAEAEALALKAVNEYRMVHSFDPFARMHPVRSATPSEASAASGSGGGGGGGEDAPSSPAAAQRIRWAFKVSVAEFYGLACADNPTVLVDMLGVLRPFHEVTLAHVWPASYQDFGTYAAEMALPGDFHGNVRNFLLLPEDLHKAFDSAKVCFIPCSAGIRMRVLRPEGLCARVAALDGVLLHLPGAAASPPRVPFKRILGWMAWLAKGANVVGPATELEMSEALGASASAEGNAALQSLVGTAQRTGYRVGAI